MDLKSTKFTPGMLLQYRDGYQGEYYETLPTKIFLSFFQRHNSNMKSWKEIAKEVGSNIPSRKFVLLVIENKTVCHSLFPSLTVTYTKCLISNPYERGETSYGWVRPEWVEEFTNQSIEQDMKDKIKIAYLSLKEKRKI